MKSAVMINDLVIDKTLDRKAMAGVFGGNGMGSAAPSALTSPTANVTGTTLSGPTGNVTPSGFTPTTSEEAAAAFWFGALLHMGANSDAFSDYRRVIPKRPDSYDK
jgi:hypothetical protein